MSPRAHACIATIAFALSAVPPLALAQVTLTIDDTVIAPKTRVGIGVNGGGGWYNFVGANLVDNPCFEGPADGSGLSQDGWPWGATNAGALTAAVDTAERVSGAQSQRLVVTGAPVALRQGRADIPQQPLVLQVTPAGTYVIKVRVKASQAGATLRLGIMVDGWTPTWGPSTPVTTGWAVYSWTYTPTANQALIGFAYELGTNATYWVDDFIAWNANDLDPDTGLSATYVNRLKDLHPATLRLGGLGVNPIPLERYLFDPWDLSYGPPPFVPEMSLNTFLKLCRAVGADPFICVPPAFSDATRAAIGDLTDDVVDHGYADHGNLVDYLGGDATTTYGARREADGFPRWDTQFAQIDLELGNELWGTPDDLWDMDLTAGEPLLSQQQRFARYNVARMTEMKARPGFRANMKVGFSGRAPDVWIGDWAGSYNVTVVPAIRDLTDFSTISMYYGPTSSASDDALYGDLFADAVRWGRQITAMKAAFTAAAGRAIETTVYEGAAVWGPYAAYLDPTIYSKDVSVGAAVSLVDHFAAGNAAGVTVNNLFHFNGNVWATITAYPESHRKPTFFAAQLFTRHITGDLVTCTVAGGGTYASNLPSEPATPLIGCYAYKQGPLYGVLVVNRHRSQPAAITIDKPLFYSAIVKLSAPDINANNERGENVTLVTEDLGNVHSDTRSVTVPPFSAYLIQGSLDGVIPAEDAGAPSGDAATTDGGPAGDATIGQDATSASDAAAPGDAAVGTDGGLAGDRQPVSGGCGCAVATPDPLAGLSLAVLLGLAILRLARRPDRR